MLDFCLHCIQEESMIPGAAQMVMSDDISFTKVTLDARILGEEIDSSSSSDASVISRNKVSKEST